MIIISLIFTLIVSLFSFLKGRKSYKEKIDKHNKKTLKKFNKVKKPSLAQLHNNLKNGKF